MDLDERVDVVFLCDADLTLLDFEGMKVDVTHSPLFELSEERTQFPCSVDVARADRRNDGWSNACNTESSDVIDNGIGSLCIAATRSKIARAVAADSNTDVVASKYFNVPVGDEDAVGLDGIATIFLEAIVENFLQMFDGSEQRLSTKDSELATKLVKHRLSALPITRVIDVSCIPHVVLVAVVALEIAGDSDWEIFDAHLIP